jgi:hypothetical protein
LERLLGGHLLLPFAFAFTFTFAFALVGFEALHSVEREEGMGWDGGISALSVWRAVFCGILFWVWFCFVLDTHHQ